MATSYRAEDIKVLTGAEVVRLRPGMYFGGVGTFALQQMLLEVVGNAVDEHLNGTATYVRVTVDGYRVTVEDDGRGIPAEDTEGRSVLERVLTQLHGASGLERKHVHLSPNLHGVGVAAVCAVSDQLDAEVWRDGWRYVQSFARGSRLGPVRRLGATERTGTRISFVPDFSVLERNAWDASWMNERCGEIAAVAPRLTVIVGQQTFRFVDGLAGYLKYLHRDEPITEPIRARGRRGGVEVEVAIAWRDRGESIVGFVNGAKCDGTHITGFLAGALRAFKKRFGDVRPGAMRRGLIAMINVMIADPVFRNPTRDWLKNPEVGAAVASAVTDGFDAAIEENPALIDSLLLRMGA
jgi:DNA gyrase subunit B